MRSLIFLATILAVVFTASPNMLNVATPTKALSISTASPMSASWLSDWLRKHCSNCDGWL